MEKSIAQRKQRRILQKRRSYLPLILVVSLVILVVVGVAAVANRDRDVKLTLVGDSVVTVEFGENFVDQGATASVDGKLLDIYISAKGKVNPDKLGSYTVTYACQYREKTYTVNRTVQVVDTQPPTIVLMHNNNVYTVPGQEYQEEGFVAEDNCDGDITYKVQRMINNGVVIYRVADSSGNVAEVTRSIRYGDETAPVLTLLGDASMTVTAGSSFVDPGIKAEDDQDGDVSDKVQIDGNVDTSRPGTYTIRYTVTDSYGNVAEAVRTVVVESVYQPPVVEPGDKVIYLTFDDGPSNHTRRLLEILAEYDVKATFFVVGTMDMTVLKQIAADGHAIALHSDTHDYEKIYTSDEAFFADMNALRQKIKNACGVDTMLMRFPGGSSNTVSKKFSAGIMTRLTQSVVAQGYRYFDWNVDSRDAADAKTAEQVFQNVISAVQGKSYSVVLQHDIFSYSVEATEMIIQWGLANGYTFKALDITSPGAHHDVKN